MGSRGWRLQETRLLIVAVMVSLVSPAGGEEPPAPPAVAAAGAPVDDASSSDSWRFFSAENLGGRGLLDMRDPFPIAQLHLQLPTDTREVMEAGEFKLTTRFRWANSFAEIRDVALIDAETYELQLGGWYALHRNFYLGADIIVRARGGGVLDPFVRGFHQAVGVVPGEREERADDLYEISVDDAQTSTRLPSGVGFGDLTLKAHWNLWRGNAWLPAVAVQGLVGLPTSTPGFGSDGVDLGLTLSLSKTLLEILHLYAVFGGAYYTRPEVEGLAFEEFGYQGSIAAEVQVLRRLSLVAQWTSYSPLLLRPIALDEQRNYLAVGLKWEVVDALEVEFGVMENLAPFENSADISFLFGLDWQF